MKTQRRPGDLQLNPASSIMGLMEQKLKVMTIFGTRPEAVKMAPVIKALREHPDHIDITVCVTAQHREMLDQVLQAFDIIPDIDLDLMDHDQTLPELTAASSPIWTLCCFKSVPIGCWSRGIPRRSWQQRFSGIIASIRVGHIEAGLRTHDKWQPFPKR